MGVVGVILLSIAISSVLLATRYVPNFALRVAATRAGVAASMPGYKPSGYAFRGPVNYSKGQVVITFKATTDDRNFSLSQQASNWNSDALLANYIEAHNKQYQTYLDRGRTLFIYDKSNATWIDDGVWFKIEGDSDLTTDQLIRIAASM
jgi:hypothetical protein